MIVHTIHDAAFKTYGRPLSGLRLEAAAKAAFTVPMPKEGIAYEASVKALEEEPEIAAAAEELFGKIPVQIGVCNGFNQEMSTVEYHKSSEVNVACTPLYLFLGHVWDIEEGRYDLSKMELFKAEAGEVFEIYATTLHFAPVEAGKDGFYSIVVLPAGTGGLLPSPGKDPSMTKVNKWVLTHPDNAAMRAKGVPVGLSGEILRV